MSSLKMSKHAKTMIIVSLVSGSCLMAGCASRGGILGVDCCADVPAGAIPEPAGTKVCNWQTEQVRSAIADQTVLYQADFVARTESLSPAAFDRMSRHAQSNLANIQPWVIQPSGDEGLDARRVAVVTEELSRQGITPIQVQLATPPALGLSGPQAERVAGGFGNIRNSGTGTGAPISRPSGLGGQAGGNLPRGIF